MLLSTFALSAVLNNSTVSNEAIAKIILCNPQICDRRVAQVTIPTLPGVTSSDKGKKTVTWSSKTPSQVHVGKVNKSGLTTTGKIVELKKK